jgi:hypothetical protein
MSVQETSKTIKFTIIKKNMNTVEIKVTQKHIDDANASIMYTSEQPRYCPMALALFEQLSGGTYKLYGRGVGHGSGNRNWSKMIAFKIPNNKYGGQMCSVADTIIVHKSSIKDEWRHCSPSTFEHTRKTAKFVNDFDNGRPVKPFSFTIDFDKTKIIS